MSRWRCSKIWVSLIYFMCSVRGWGRRTRLSCYLCYLCGDKSAVHSGDGRSEDPILEGLLNRTSGDSATQQVKESNSKGGGAFRETHTGNPPLVTAAGQTPKPPRHSHAARQPQALSPARRGRASTGLMSPTTGARAARKQTNCRTIYKALVLSRESPTSSWLGFVFLAWFLLCVFFFFLF